MKTKSGRVLTDADVDRLASKAEAGFDLSNWKPRRQDPAPDVRGTAKRPESK